MCLNCFTGNPKPQGRETIIEHRISDDRSHRSRRPRRSAYYEGYSMHAVSPTQAEWTDENRVRAAFIPPTQVRSVRVPAEARTVSGTASNSSRRGEGSRRSDAGSRSEGQRRSSVGSPRSRLQSASQGPSSPRRERRHRSRRHHDDVPPRAPSPPDIIVEEEPTAESRRSRTGENGAEVVERTERDGPAQGGSGSGEIGSGSGARLISTFDP